MTKGLKFVSMGVNYTSYDCTSLEEVKEVLSMHPQTEKIEIRSCMKSFGFFNYNINTESIATRKNIIKINYITAPKEQIIIKMPIEIVLESDMFKLTQRSVCDTEIHYFGGRLVGNINLPYYKWKSSYNEGYKSVSMSNKYDYLIDEEGINEFINFIQK